MKWFVIIAIALRALRRNKTRSLLTALGIIIGIAAVIAVLSVGRGAAFMVQAQINSMGNNMIWVFNGSSHGGGVHGGSGSHETLTAEDGDSIMMECEHAVAMTPQINTSAQLVYKENNWFTTLRGVASAYLEVRSRSMSCGAFFTEGDVRGATRVCVIGQTVVDNLFGPGEDPVGKVIRIKNMVFRVLGVFDLKGSTAWGSDQDDVIVIPWTSLRQTIEKSPFSKVTQLSVTVDDDEHIEATKEEIRGILRQRHHLAAGAEDDFKITDPAEMSRTSTEVTGMMTTLLTAIASISLAVGGIGIMNIMLVSVTERTREIGLRMAIGARGRDILLQFLVEAIVLSAAGGIIGISIGIFAAWAVAHSNHWPVLISMDSIALGLGVSAAVGVCFGFFPALRASRLNPIDSLRYE